MEPVAIETRISGFRLMAVDPARLTELNSGERRVFHELCRRADRNAECYPSQGRLAKDLGLTRPWVNKVLARLEAKGFILRLTSTSRRSLTYRINLEKLGLVAPSPAHETEEAAAPAPAPAQAPRQDPAAQTLTRVLEALDALTRRVEAVERTLARMAESQGAPVEAPKPVAPVTPEGKAERREQLSLGLGDSTPKWDAEDGFSRFWAAWPDKQDKQRARKAFGKVMAKQKDPEAHLQLMLSVIARKKTERKWREGIYMQAATFLNNARWNDEPEKERAGRNDAEFLHATTEEEDDLIARMEGRA